MVGSSLEVLRDPWAFDNGRFARYGAVFRARVLGRVSVSLVGPDLLKQALLDRGRKLSSAEGWGHSLDGLFQNGLMLRDFDDHQRHRKLMQFAFRGVARRGYHEALERGVAEQLEKWDQDEPFEAYPRIKAALFEQSGRMLLGVEPSARLSALNKSFAAMIRASVALLRWPIPGTPWQRGQRGRRRLEAFFREELPKRRAGGGEDLFSVLCAASDEDGTALSDEEIIDHMIFLLFASHDTTATALTTLVDELTRAPRLQDRAARECELLATRYGGVLPFDALGELEFLDLCIREALRLNPPVPYIMRRTVSACPFGGHELPAHTPVVVHVRTTQHDPKLWPEPLAFEPDRYRDEEEGRERSPYASVPFGGGAHRCIGADLAKQQIKVFMFHLLRRYRVQRVEAEATPWRRLPLPVPANGLPVRVIPRGSGTTSTIMD